FTATQGAVQGQVDCGPEDTCVLLASDAGGKEDSDSISFDSITNPNPNGPATLTVQPNSNLGATETVTVSGTGFSPEGSISIFECKLNGGGTQSCDLVGTAFSDAQGNFGPTDVTVSREFVAEQGVLGPVSCLPENDCVVYATDPGNRDDAAPITFAQPVTPTTVPPTTVPPTTSTTVAPSASCAALLSARASFNSTIDQLQQSFPALGSFYSYLRILGNIAFDSALRIANCSPNTSFVPQGATSDARVMRSVLPARVLASLQAAPAPTATQVSTPAPSAAPATYTVVPGDTLSRIAARMLGSAALYPQLIASNPSLAANPNLIHPGQVLVLTA
ncbi:MAG: neocarzinostatin apoprotein domain-containing protein, partial [Acidimicrobiales bacterium]|nr:neocarzinostatin apoprotein domain-containing protein [Acidimicrobiales bacterium]